MTITCMALDAWQLNPSVARATGAAEWEVIGNCDNEEGVTFDLLLWQGEREEEWRERKRERESTTINTINIHSKQPLLSSYLASFQNLSHSPAEAQTLSFFNLNIQVWHV